MKNWPVKNWTTLAALSGAMALSACATDGGFAGGGASGVRLAAGDQYTYVIKDKATISFFGQEQVTEATTTMALNVLSAGRDPRWRWTYADFSIDAMDLPEEDFGGLDLKQVSAIMAPAVRLGTALGFECKVDASGGCAALSNWGTWRGVIEDAVLMTESAVKIGMAANEVFRSELGVLEQAIPDEGAPEDLPPGMELMEPEDFPDFAGGPDFDQRTVDLVINIIINLLDGIDERAAGAAALSGVWGPQNVQGASLRAGAASDFTRAIALPYGGGDLIYRGTRTVESVDRAAGVAMVVSKTELDGEAFKASLLKIYDNLVTPNLKAFAQYSPEDGMAALAMSAMVRSQMEMVLSQSSLKFTDTTRGTIDLATGLARETTTEYAVTFKGGGDFDWVEGALSGTQTVTVSQGAPTITRLQRREIAPPPAPKAADPAAAPPRVMPDTPPPVAAPPAAKPKR